MGRWKTRAVRTQLFLKNDCYWTDFPQKYRSVKTHIFDEQYMPFQAWIQLLLLEVLVYFFSISDILSSVDPVINIKDLLELFLEFACMITN
jgi:hypothetical protein